MRQTTAVKSHKKKKKELDISLCLEDMKKIKLEVYIYSNDSLNLKGNIDVCVWGGEGDGGASKVPTF